MSVKQLHVKDGYVRAITLPEEKAATFYGDIYEVPLDSEIGVGDPFEIPAEPEAPAEEPAAPAPRTRKTAA